MHLRHSLIIVTSLSTLLAGCATNREAEFQHQTKSIQRGLYLLSATNSPPGSYYELGVYVIGKGDSLALIARKFQVSVTGLAAINPGLDPTRLVIGQRIRVYERKKE